ncbi:MAG: tetratricopeptide repeat protein [Pseudomonadota bacterium]
MIKRIILLIALATLLPAAAVGADMLDDLEAAFRAHRKGEYDQAIELYTKIIRNRELKARERAISYLLRGEAAKDKGDLDGAVKDFDRALRINPNYAQAHYFRGLALEKKGLLAEAFVEVRNASAIKPDDEAYRKKMTMLEAKITAKGGTIPPLSGTH